MNFTATSAGRQLDRLALLYLGDTEVWRTSTAEPRLAPGIIWTYWKDMTPYLSMWKTKQKVIFDLPNLIGKCRAPRPRPPAPRSPRSPPVHVPMYVLIISSHTLPTALRQTYDYFATICTALSVCCCFLFCSLVGFGDLGVGAKTANAAKTTDIRGPSIAL